MPAIGRGNPDSAPDSSDAGNANAKRQRRDANEDGGGVTTEGAVPVVQATFWKRPTSFGWTKIYTKRLQITLDFKDVETSVYRIPYANILFYNDGGLATDMKRVKAETTPFKILHAGFKIDHMIFTRVDTDANLHDVDNKDVSYAFHVKDWYNNGTGRRVQEGTWDRLHHIGKKALDNTQSVPKLAADAGTVIAREYLKSPWIKEYAPGAVITWERSFPNIGNWYRIARVKYDPLKECTFEKTAGPPPEYTDPDEYMNLAFPNSWPHTQLVSAVAERNMVDASAKGPSQLLITGSGGGMRRYGQQYLSMSKIQLDQAKKAIPTETESTTTSTTTASAAEAEKRRRNWLYQMGMEVGQDSVLEHWELAIKKAEKLCSDGLESRQDLIDSFRTAYDGEYNVEFMVEVLKKRLMDIPESRVEEIEQVDPSQIYPVSSSEVVWECMTSVKDAYPPWYMFMPKIKNSAGANMQWTINAILETKIVLEFKAFMQDDFYPGCEDGNYFHDIDMKQHLYSLPVLSKNVMAGAVFPWGKGIGM